MARMQRRTVQHDLQVLTRQSAAAVSPAHHQVALTMDRERDRHLELTN